MFPEDKVTVGNMTYGEINVYGFDRPDTTLTIGDYCSLAGNVRFWVGGEHPIKFFSTFPFAHKMEWKDRMHPELASKGSIVVENDVWIGESAIILSGVTIGQGAVIGAGSVVSKDVPPYGIFVGNNVIKKRFDDDIVEELELIDLKSINIEQYKDICDVAITQENYKDIVRKLKA